MTSQSILLILLLAVDIALWAAALTAPLTAKGRYRAFALAFLLLVALAGNIVGWSLAISVAAISLWIAAIAKSSISLTPDS